MFYRGLFRENLTCKSNIMTLQHKVGIAIVWDIPALLIPNTSEIIDEKEVCYLKIS